MSKKKTARSASDHLTVDHILGAQNEQPDRQTLGHLAAVVIATNCAGASPSGLGKSLSSLGVAGIPFQMCVYGSVTHQGFQVAAKDIPDGPDDLLIDVVTAIENAPVRK